MVVRYRIIVACSGLLVADLFTAAVHGQRVTVQLPTFRQFSMTTTVVVPDRGGVYLGGVNRVRRHAMSLGTPLFPGRNRGRGGATAASGVSVQAWIHDLEAMDQAILNEWAAASKSRSPQAQRNRVTLPKPPEQPTKTIGELKRIQRAADLANQERAIADFQAAKRVQEQGKPKVARIYYQMALRRATGDLKNQIAHRLGSLSATKVAGNVNRQDPIRATACSQAVAARGAVRAK